MKSTSTFTRREFLRRATLGVGAFGAAPLIITNAFGRPSPSERITLGFIGVGGRGRFLINSFIQHADVHVVAVCDVFRAHRNQAKAMVDARYGNQDCATYIDVRDLLARPDIDAVCIATGDNNHAPCSLLAARAGKDIFCEKPMGVTAAEGRAVTDTVRRFGCIYQCGTQRRNVSNFVFAAELARSGRLGEIRTMHAEKAFPVSGVHFSVYDPQPEPAYEELAWDLWLGPAAWRPFSVQYTQRPGWIDHGDFSGGSITEWGTHTVDICQWALDADHTAPVHYETINEMGDVEATYANGVKLFIRTGLRFGTCPIRIEGTEGWVETGDSGEMETYPASLMAERRFAGGYSPEGHVREFLNSVKTRRPPRSTADVAHRSTLACQCANISVRLNRPVTLDPEKEEFPGDPDATRLLSRTYREPWVL